MLRSHLLDGVSFSRIALVDAVVLRPWITPTTRHKQEYPDAYRTMPNHIFEKILTSHLRTATARPMDGATFGAVFGQWRGEDGQARYMRNLARFYEAYTAEFEPLLESMRTLVRIIWGEHDAWLDPAFALRLHELLPDSDLKIIPGAGHFVMEDAPEEVTRELQNFFSAEGDVPRQGSSKPHRDDGVPDYLNKPLAAFLDRVASGEPAPGGGAVAAVAVSLAAGLCGMSARLFAEHLDDADELTEWADRLRGLAARPSHGRTRRRTGASWPPTASRKVDGDPGLRRECVRTALAGAADVPLEIAEAGAYVAEVADRLAWEGNPNLRGDALAAALLAEAGTRTAAALVHINAAGNGSDGRLERADELASKASEVALRAVEDDGS